ncbi:MAG: phage major capsid protein, partial [Anaerolineae bacterium]|nr:phage major capsid protein [Anaerolineae bacterium]
MSGDAVKLNMTEEQAALLLDVKKVEGELVKKFEDIEKNFSLAHGQLEETGKVATETKQALEKLSEDYNGLLDRVHEMEQKGVKLQEDATPYDLGAEFIKSEQFNDILEGRTSRARMEVKTAIINATGQNQPLVPADRLAGINTTPNRILRIRNVLPATPTNSNLIEFVRENVFTNNAGPQVGGSPEQFENVTKPESGITFTLATEAVRTLAHFIPASKQVIEDSPSL